MNHRISAGALVFKGEAILLVRHCVEGEYDFWVPPGGGVKGRESLMECARRETFEETGIDAQPLRIVYLEEFIEEGRHYAKSWILSEMRGGQLSDRYREADETFLIDASFVPIAELPKRNVYPQILKTARFLDDVANGFPEFRYLGMTPTLLDSKAT